MTLHTTRHENRAVARSNQKPGRKDSRKLTGPERSKGPTETGRTSAGTLLGENEQIRSNPKQPKKNAQNNRGRHKQHPPKGKTQGRLTRVPTHNPETSRKGKWSTLKGQKPTTKKGGQKLNEKGRSETDDKEKTKREEYLGHTECSVLKKVLLVRFGGSSPTISSTKETGSLRLLSSGDRRSSLHFALNSSTSACGFLRTLLLGGHDPARFAAAWLLEHNGPGSRYSTLLANFSWLISQ